MQSVELGIGTLFGLRVFHIHAALEAYSRAKAEVVSHIRTMDPGSYDSLCRTVLLWNQKGRTE
jgi:hypothetical protein